MIGELPDFTAALREVCRVLGHEPDEEVVQRLYEERLFTKARPFIVIEPPLSKCSRDCRREAASPRRRCCEQAKIDSTGEDMGTDNCSEAL